MEEKIRANIKKFREAAGLSQKALAGRIQKSESAVQAYESGKTDIPLSALVAIAVALKVSVAELADGKTVREPDRKPMEIRIYTQEDRLNVAAILVKNGYNVGQGKRLRTQTGKSLDYFLHIEDSAENADTSR